MSAGEKATGRLTQSVVDEARLRLIRKFCGNLVPDPLLVEALTQQIERVLVMSGRDVLNLEKALEAFEAATLRGVGVA